MMDPAGTIRAVVVDDEQLARDEVCFLLGEIGGVEVVGQAADGVEALQVIEAENPDLVMLDVQMPGLSGFEVARRLAEVGGDTQLVFVTAFDQHAVHAFEVNAVDYVLKPVEAARLTMAVDRVRRRLAPSVAAPNRPTGIWIAFCSCWRSGPNTGSSSRSRSRTGSC